MLGIIVQLAISWLLVWLFEKKNLGVLGFRPLYIPIAIHLGWNFTHGFVFPEGSIGNGILIYVKPVSVVNVSYFIYYIVIYFPMVSMLLINFFLLKRRKTVMS